jgi:hypothetical protein
MQCTWLTWPISSNTNSTHRTRTVQASWNLRALLYIFLFFFSRLLVTKSHPTLFPLSSLTLPNGKDSTRVDGLTPLKRGWKKKEYWLEFKVLWDLWKGHLVTRF